MNIKNILCPTDFSTSSHTALMYASSLAKQYGAELHIVYVYEEAFGATEGSFPVYVQSSDIAADKKRLNGVAPVLPDVSFQRQFIIGHPPDRLLEYAKDNDIDLIVMGTHGRTGLGRLLMGSVAEAVLRRAHCPVLTLKEPVGQRAKEGSSTTQMKGAVQGASS